MNTGVGCYFLFPGIFPTQGLNLCLLHCRWILYPMSHQGSPIVKCVCVCVCVCVFPWRKGLTRARMSEAQQQHHVVALFTPLPPTPKHVWCSSFLSSQVEPTTKVSSRCSLDCLRGAFYREGSDPKCLCCSGSISQSCLLYTARQWDRSAALSPYFSHLNWAPSLAKQKPEPKAALPEDSAFLTWRDNHLKSKNVGPCRQSGTWTLPWPLARRNQAASTPSSKPQNVMRATKCYAHLVCYLMELP